MARFKLLPFFLLTILSLNSCDKGNKNCSQEHVEYYVRLEDPAGDPVEPDRYYTYRLSNDDLVNQGKGDTTRVYPPQGYALVLEDMILLGKEMFRFTAYVDSVMVVDERYIFTYDGCHIFKTEGKDTVVINP